MKTIWNDLADNRKSGLSVGLISVPLSLSLAIASGATPLQWILTAVRAWVVSALCWSSRYNIIGPTWALSWLILTTVLSFGVGWYAILPRLAIIVWVWIMLFYALKLTKYITLIPSTALHGFILWVAIILTTGQINGALWLTNLPTWESVIHNLFITIQYISTTNWQAFILFSITLIILLIRKEKIKQFPGIIPVSIIGIIIGMWIHYEYINWNIITLMVDMQTKQFPALVFVPREWTFWTQWRTILASSSTETLKRFIILSLSISIIAIIETVISAKIADKITSTKHNQEKEIFWLALGNIASWLMGWIPATAALVRTNLNIKSWATSIRSALWSALFIVIISALLFWYVRYIPIPVMSAILVSIAIGMIDISNYRKIYYYDMKSFWILLLVWLLTFVFDPIIGVVFGTAISLLLYLRHATQGKIYGTLFRNKEFIDKITLDEYIKQQKKWDVYICKFSWEINFICIAAEIEQITKIKSDTVVILSFSNISYIDIDGIEVFEEVIQHFEQSGHIFYFSGVTGRILQILNKTDFFHYLDDKHKVFSSSSEVLQHLGIWSK